MAAVEDSFATSESPDVMKKLFDTFAAVFNTFKRRVVLWNQHLNRVFSFEGPTTGAEGALDVQIIVSRDAQGEGLFYVVAPGFPLKAQLELALSAVRGRSARLRAKRRPPGLAYSTRSRPKLAWRTLLANSRLSWMSRPCFSGECSDIFASTAQQDRKVS